jgi:hypothetical protein
MTPYIADLEAEAARTIVLPFPPASLSGHNTGDKFTKAPIIAKHRDWACSATRAARIAIPAAGDIPIHVRFVPPDRRGDRLNFWNRCKPYFDGIAQALKTNDARFLPSMSFADPEKPGRVEVTL